MTIGMLAAMSTPRPAPAAPAARPVVPQAAPAAPDAAPAGPADVAPRGAQEAVRGRQDACPGTLRLHAADDGALARVRIPGGVLDVRRARALADAAARLGDGDLHLTSRGNVQLRGLRDGCGGELAAALDAAGLLPSPAHERVRNVVASPLSGLDGQGSRDVRPWLTALDALLCGSAPARDLSGRFLFALDDGRGDVAGLGADVVVQALEGAHARLLLGPRRESLRVPAEHAPEAALTAAHTFLDLARDTEGRTWRISDLALPDGELRNAVAGRLAAAGIPARRDAEPAREPHAEGAAARGPRPGRVGDALCVHVPFGRLTALQWDVLIRLAAAHAGELRLTPWRGVVVPVPGIGAADADDALARCAAAGLVTGDSPWLRVGACVGRPGCAKSRADVRADAGRMLPAVVASPLPLYWSGCARRCGAPRGDRVDVVAAPEGGYRVTRAGDDGQDARATPLRTPGDLAAALRVAAP
ncbi:precorrin-3B synthase [Streptomyces sp. NPDC060194]|uniref:precorrin-3B synthase n=1 Tax=Streptomyces sp. NPDC060194 TaxID=3347069 RepID=UPI0036652495